MNFLYPQFLFALFTVLIPVVIHLFNFQRHKKVPFSNVAFLKEVKHTTKARSTLKHLLILSSRILAIIALVLAFTQPYLPVSEQGNANKTLSASLFLDNSFSMQNQNTDGRIFDLAREFSFLLSDQLPSHINHQFLTNSFTGAEQHLYPTSEISKKIEAVKIIPASQHLSEIIMRQKSAFDENEFNGYIVSDFQKSQYDFSPLSFDSLSNFTLIPISPVKTNNISIDSVWFNSPVHRVQQPEEIHFRLHNYSTSTAETVRVKLSINNELKAYGDVTIPAQANFDTILVYSNAQTGLQQGVLEISDSPIQFDNSFYFSFTIANEIKVLTISSAESQNFVKRAFEVDSYFSYQEVNENQIDFNALAKTDVLILNGITKVSSGMIASITDFVENGGDLIVFPNNNINQDALNSLLKPMRIAPLGSIDGDSTRINFIDLEHKLYQNVFSTVQKKINLPSIYSHFLQPTRNHLQETTLLRTVNNHKILTNWKVAKGDVYVFSVSLDPKSSNLPAHSLFLPTLYQVAFTSADATKAYYTITDDEVIQAPYAPVNNQLFHITNANKTIDLIPETYIANNTVQLNVHGDIKIAGNYNLLMEDRLVDIVSFNYSRKESNPECYTAGELESMIDSIGLTNFTVLNSSINNFSTDFETTTSGVELWRWFLLLALIFIAIEIILIRFFKPSIL